FRLYLEKRLSKDFIVKSFENGLDALECIKKEYPDLVICDIMLHGMYGNELSSRLKTSGETSVIPIILYGSHIDIGQRSKRESSLADIFLYIPFHVEDLKIEMNVLIRNNRFLRKSFLERIFGKKFLEVEKDKILDENNYDFINQVKEFILRNIDKENLTIDEIASEQYMSRTAFFTKWKALTGEAPKYLIYRIRMEKARELLESGKYPVNVLPEMIGLKSLKNFRHKYKEYFGITPSESIMKKQ
uniref:response regulator transcription factor n=2 Tax=Bacteroidaceae TaxID=815 RepID=UPI00307D9439